MFYYNCNIARTNLHVIKRERIALRSIVSKLNDDTDELLVHFLSTDASLILDGHKSVIAGSFRVSLFIGLGCLSDLGKRSGCFMIIRCPIGWFLYHWHRLCTSMQMSYVATSFFFKRQNDHICDSICSGFSGSGNQKKGIQMYSIRHHLVKNTWSGIVQTSD